MLFPSPLIKGKILKRYKRFLCDIQLENNLVITAHCPNSGSMLGLIKEFSTVYLSEVINPKAKLKYKLELIEVDNSLVGVNTLKANTIVYDALKRKLIPELNRFDNLKTEVIFQPSCRFDFMLYGNKNNINETLFLEVKSVTLKRNNNLAEFPDAVTVRGKKHIEKLVEAKKQGINAAILFLIQREDCTSFDIAKDIDKEYYNQLIYAISRGVEILCYNCKVFTNEIKINQPVKIIFCSN